MKILVMGIGNPILTDDAVGILVARELEGAPAEIVEASVGGFSLLDYIRGYDVVIIVDAVKLGDPPGTVSILNEVQVPRALHTSSSHDVSFSEAIRLGKVLFPEEMPSRIVVVGIEVSDTDTFSESPTEPVKNAVPEAARLVSQLLETMIQHP
ncbi:MAG: hydrogenase maturation protease [Theionarchaea archaeon]|nr:hydrogenase maturation protease [Theionarchaea archaeon]MBU7000843.1 hydrogenase maturation protease [Theionarchaea archaeon]MBU7021616.1 hydrogenase maturation protease [Theionarchaea archaeon]MBU7034921.1 hydrogenase maturation protease [Theionarchaea archaeon]MBU7039397.1 hydrogenase maturation protease [Theionarchaea archaeon]